MHPTCERPVSEIPESFPSGGHGVRQNWWQLQNRPVKQRYGERRWKEGERKGEAEQAGREQGGITVGETKGDERRETVGEERKRGEKRET